MARDYTRCLNYQIRACAGSTSSWQIARASRQSCHWRDWTTAGVRLETNSSSPSTECSSTPQTPNGPTTQASPMQSGPVLRKSRQETHLKSRDNPNKPTSPQRTTKPRADPTADMDKLNQRTIQLIKSAVEDGDGRRAGKLVKGISGMAPAADVKKKLVQALSRAQNAEQ